MHRISWIGILFLVACPGAGPATTDTPAGDCTVIDTTALGGGGTLSAGCYSLEQDLDIAGDVVLEDGVRIIVDPGLAITIERSGSLHAQGTEGGGVRIEGMAADSWLGLHFDDAGSPSNTLAYTTIQGACSGTWNGNATSYGAVFADDGARLNIESLTVEDCSQTGLHIFDTSVNFTLNGFSTNANVPARLGAMQAGSLSGIISMTGVDTTLHINDGVVDGVSVLPSYAYTLDDDLDVTSDLTIGMGAVLTFEQNFGMDVTDGGSLNAVGDADNLIIFRGADAVSGYWMGVHFEDSVSGDNQLDYVEILNAGSDNWHGGDDSKAGLYLEGNEVRLTITNSRIAHSEGPALIIDGADPADKISVSATVFEGCARGAAISPDAVDALDVDVVFLDNTDDRVRIFNAGFGADELDEDVVWAARDVAYYVDDTIFVYGTLHIEAGATVVFDDNTGLSVGDWPNEGGTLTIGALDGEQVLLTGDSAVAGYWRGLYYNQTLNPNRVYNARVEYAGASPWNGSANSQAAVYLYLNATLDLQDVTFADNEFFDVYVDDGSTLTSCAGIVGLVDGSDGSTFCTP